MLLISMLHSIIGIKVMEKYFGFTIERKTSTIHNGGNGVFITKGRAKQKSLVALYPGKFGLTFALEEDI